MSLRLFTALLCLAFGLPASSWAASFVLSDLEMGSGAVDLTEVRGPHAYTADGALQFSIDWDAVGPAPVRLDLKMSWVNHVSPRNDGYLSGDSLAFGGYMYNGQGSSGSDWGFVEPSYQEWSDGSVAFGYANLTPEFTDYTLVWDFFGWGDTVDWRLEYALAPVGYALAAVPVPAAGLLFASALGLAAFGRRGRGA